MPPKDEVSAFVRILAPYALHIAEELWEKLQSGKFDVCRITNGMKGFLVANRKYSGQSVYREKTSGCDTVPSRC